MQLALHRFLVYLTELKFIIIPLYCEFCQYTLPENNYPWLWGPVIRTEISGLYRGLYMQNDNIKRIAERACRTIMFIVQLLKPVIFAHFYCYYLNYILFKMSSIK